MTDFEKQEFWNALGRLYDSSLKTQENLEALRGRVEKLGDTVDGLSVATDKLLSATRYLHSVAESDERRLDKYEVTVQAILEDLRHRREGDAR